MKIFISAIGTDSGKTLVSSIFAEALKADYWKPVQAGYPRDTDVVKSLVTNTTTRYFNETYLFKNPESPHSASKKEGIQIQLENIQLPDTRNHLIVEGAGGLMVPLNDANFVIDIPEKLNLPVILVSNLYLGSINHTLLSVQELKRRNMDLLGIVFNGETNPDAEEIILKHSGTKVLLKIKKESIITSEVIQMYARELKLNSSFLFSL